MAWSGDHAKHFELTLSQYQRQENSLQVIRILIFISTHVTINALGPWDPALIRIRAGVRIPSINCRAALAKGMGHCESAVIRQGIHQRVSIDIITAVHTAVAVPTAGAAAALDIAEGNFRGTTNFIKNPPTGRGSVVPEDDIDQSGTDGG